MKAPVALRRETFKTSRLAEFCSRKELVNQTGHAVEEWPLVILKELVDNALDACEEACVAPVVEIAVSNDGITVADNGPGLAPETVADMLDYTSRVSSREAYVSPTRGAQGNALKTILAMPFALGGERGETVIESRRVRHRLVFTIDRIRQEPRIEHVQEPSTVRIGARVTVRWPNSACSILDDAKSQFLLLALKYACVNPHLTLSVDWDRQGGTANDGDDEPVREVYAATNPDWRKWRPSDATSAHWYDEAQLGRLMAAHIAHAQDHGLACRTVRDFVRDFRGLSGTQKAAAICETVGASTRMSLAEFYGVADDGNARMRLKHLLRLMRANSQPIKPKDLGMIGESHMLGKLADFDADPETLAYKAAAFEDNGVPYVVEVAFGYCPEATSSRAILTGINWSVSIGADPFRNLPPEGDSLSAILADQWAGPEEPIVVVAHVASPRIGYLDRGKSSVALAEETAKRIVDLVKNVTKKWTKQRKAEERDAQAIRRRRDALTRRDRPLNIKQAAALVLHDAYMKASADGTLPANARQVYYAARPEILALTGKDDLDSQYFCQTVLVNYIQEHSLDWDIAWDDRGHFMEPHTGRTIGLGTIAVRKYLRSLGAAELIEAAFAAARIITRGPDCRFGAVLFIEKEGFLPLLEAVRLAERYDIAIMSSKGMSVTAARMLADHMCSAYDIPLLTLHDFDRTGFSIGETVGSDTKRYTFKNKIEVVNLGLRLADVERLDLEFEPAPLGDADPEKLRERLRINGATEAEIECLVDNQQRVELNAMTSDVFVKFVEDKLVEHGFKKVVPDNARLDEAYRLFKRGEHLRRIVEEILARGEDVEVAAPDDLAKRVRAYLEANPEATWDEALRRISEDEDPAETGSLGALRNPTEGGA